MIMPFVSSSKPGLLQAVENDLKVAAKARKEVENQAQRMLAQGMETQVMYMHVILTRSSIISGQSNKENITLKDSVPPK